MTSRSASRFLLIALTLALLAACTSVDNGSNAIIVGGDEDGFEGAVLTEPYDVPAQRLSDTEGAKYSLAKDATSPLTLVFFGYTHCPDICQIVMSTIASALTRLDADEREQVSVVFVTTDPARDDGEVLRAYLDQFDASFIGLTGDLDTIVAIGDPLGIMIGEGEPLPSGGYEIAHSTHIVAVAPDGTAPLVWTEGTSSADLAADIRKFLDQGGVE